MATTSEKYRINALAKDFDINSKFIIEKLSENFEGEKKSQTALDEKELDFSIYVAMYGMYFYGNCICW